MMGPDRYEYVGTFLTPAVKKALKAEAKKRKTSLSKLTSDFLKEKLQQLGHTVDKEQAA